MAPAKGARRFLFCRRNCPTALADAPKATNTTEKPITNANEDAIRLPRGFSPRRNCSTPIPESIEMYPGTRGSTHGERNEISPATKAARIETCKVSSYSEIREIRYSSLRTATFISKPRTQIHAQADSKIVAFSNDRFIR